MTLDERLYVFSEGIDSIMYASLFDSHQTIESTESIENIDKRDIDILRSLGEQIAKLAARDIEREKIKVWTQNNDLSPERVPIYCDPDNSWHEIIPESELLCTSKLCKEIEMQLRKDVIWGECLKDDRVIENVIRIPYVGGISDWGLFAKRVGAGGRSAYNWIAPLADYKDMDKLHFPGVSVDISATKERVEFFRDVFAGMLTVECSQQWWWTLGMTMILAYLRGLAQIMYDMYDYPEELHKLMTFLCDGHLAVLGHLEDNKLLSSNVGNVYISTGGFGFTNQLPQTTGPAMLKNMWGYAESQETTAVSPEMFNEFILPYQIRVLEKFGLNSYGCCEPLDFRVKYLKQIPNLRKITVSPWSDIALMAEQLQDKFVLTYKPNPAPLALNNMNEDIVRLTLRDALEKTKDCVVELVMTDNHTLGDNPENAYRWVQIAREECARVGKG